MYSNGLKVEAGMSVSVITSSKSPLGVSKDKEAIKQAFIRSYGFDVTKALPLCSSYYDVKVVS
jgi:hypothetical protein